MTHLLRRDLEDLGDCAKDQTAQDALVRIKTSLKTVAEGIVQPLVKAACLDNGLAFNEQTQECVRPPIGLDPSQPAASCRQLLSLAHGKESGPFWIELPSGPEQMYCDQTRL